MQCYKVFLSFLILRILSVFIVKTWYVPDEYWQSLEVAHRLAFGYGYLTWEWTKGIRSYIYPMIISGVYKILEYLKLDEVHLLVLVPRILQALLTAYSDYRFYIFSGKTKWSIFIVATSWFIFYTGSRTLINTVEMALTTIALSYFPFYSENTSFLWPVALLCFIRPTAAIPWFPFCLYHMKKSVYTVLQLVFKRYIPIGLIVGSVAIGIDSYAHGSLLITPWEFLKVNVINEIGSFYGVHSWNWYFIIGLPTALGVTLLPFLMACFKTLKERKVYPIQSLFLVSIFLTLVVYSLLPHKEFRFVLPIIPMCLYITQDYISRWSRKASISLVWVVAFVLFIGNIVPAGYLSLVHQRGTLDVMPHLAKIAREFKTENGQSPSIMFLMPCHSTPYYSHIHANTTMRFLTCNPNFKEVDHYVDEADQFYQDPALWLRKHFPVFPRSSLPTHIVTFDILVPKIQDFLSIYKQIISYFHSDISTGRVGKYIVIFERFDAADNSKPDPTTSKPISAPSIQNDELDTDEYL
jgi:phosphatidylinositol glycan class B